MVTTRDEKTVAILLALFLGGFGAHRFYLGKTGSAVCMLLISITIIGIPISGFWALIDIILIATDNLGKNE